MKLVDDNVGSIASKVVVSNFSFCTPRLSATMIGGLAIG
jgi:hypothetical protein